MCSYAWLSFSSFLVRSHPSILTPLFSLHDLHSSCLLSLGWEKRLFRCSQGISASRPWVLPIPLSRRTLGGCSLCFSAYARVSRLLVPWPVQYHSEPNRTFLRLFFERSPVQAT